MNVLLIDDDKQIHLLVKKILAHHDINLIHAFFIQEGIDKLKTNEINLIITDIVMDGIDGLSFLSLIKRDRDFKSIPVIVITSNTDPETEKIAVSQGAVGFLTKPVEESKLTNLISTISYLDQNKSVEPISDDYFIRKMQKVTGVLTKDSIALNYETSIPNYLDAVDRIFDFSAFGFFKKTAPSKFELISETGFISFLEDLRFVPADFTPNHLKMINRSGPVFSNDVLRHPNPIIKSWANHFSLISEVILPFHYYELGNGKIGSGTNRKTEGIAGFFWGFRGSILSSKECEVLIRLSNLANPILFDLQEYGKSSSRKTHAI
ncbi:MAG: response regulator [Bacteroidetes bacterium]|nr:response regulator [Bacteroidota bacterium]